MLIRSPSDALAFALPTRFALFVFRGGLCAASAGLLLLSGGHDALLDDGRRWCVGRAAATHCVARCAAVGVGAEMAVEAVEARLATRDSLVENIVSFSRADSAPVAWLL